MRTYPWYGKSEADAEAWCEDGRLGRVVLVEEEEGLGGCVGAED